MKKLKGLMILTAYCLLSCASCSTTYLVNNDDEGFDREDFEWIEEGKTSSDLLLKHGPIPFAIWGMDDGGVVVFYFDNRTEIDATAIPIDDPYHDSPNKAKWKQASVYLSKEGLIRTWEYFGQDGHRSRTVNVYEGLSALGSGEKVFEPSFSE
ncbi:MAG: hypothetical protein HQ519_11840 [Planctomycetes bacterium]|nr:hypothetical protein [Planctomycetota bacterium]